MANHVDPSANIVGNAFAHQYYSILELSPEHVHKFYHKDSLVSRPQSDETRMTTVDIKRAKLDCQSYHLSTIDSQLLSDNGVMVLVTGSIVGSDKVSKTFVQTFFLARSDRRAYSIMNDIFKFVHNEEVVPIPSQTSHVEVDVSNGDETDHVTRNCEHGKNVVPEKSVVVDEDEFVFL